MTAFAFAPAASALGGGQWTAADGAEYVVRNIAVHVSQFGVGDTPDYVPRSGDWNGSLWTLFYEVLCYLVIAACVTVVGHRRLAPVVAGLWLIATVAQLTIQIGGFLSLFIELVPYFLAGAALYAFRERVPLHWALGAGAAALAVVLLAVGAAPVLTSLPLAYVMLWLGAALPLRRLGRSNDISYGMYVYAFPVQQMLTVLGASSLPVGLFVALSILGTLPFAAASWFVVERPAQRFRRLADRTVWARPNMLGRRK